GLERLSVRGYPDVQHGRQDGAGGRRRLRHGRHHGAHPHGRRGRAGRDSTPAAGIRVSAADHPGSRVGRGQGMTRLEGTVMSQPTAPRPLPRRHRPRTAALAGAGLGLGAALLPRRAEAETAVRFSGWAFEPQVVEANVKRFMEQNPDVKVEYTPLDLQLYNEKMVALFNAGTQPDAYYVRDINLGAWVEAGWVQPIDGLPGLADLDRD